LHSTAQVVAINDTLYLTEDASINSSVALNDTIAIGDVVQFSVSDSPNNGILVFNNDGTFMYVPEQNASGEFNFTYSVCNQTEQCDTALVVMYIAAVNDDPNVVFESYEMDEDDTLSGNLSLNDFDPEGAVLYYELLDAPQYGDVIISSNGQFTYTPQYNFFGNVIINYWCCDALIGGLCEPGQITITVLPINDAPYVYNGSSTICQGAQYIGDIMWASQDVDGDAISVTAASCDDGNVDFNANGEITFTPDLDYIGYAIIEFTVCDNYVTPACASFVKYVDVRANHMSIATLALVQPTCPGRNNGSVGFSISGGIGYYNIAWNTGHEQNSAGGYGYLNNLLAGNYSATIVNTGGCAADTTFYFDLPNLLNEGPILNSSISNINCLDGTAEVSLSGSGSGGPPYTFQWLTHEAGIVQTVERGNYPIVIIDAMGCRDTVTLAVEVPLCSFDQLQIPEGFSPDGDGINDYFEIPGIEQFPDNSLIVFNTWGTQVFDSVHYRSTWDGKDRPSGELLPEGTYYYVLKVKDQQDVKGHVIIKYTHH
jgi:gliding motility-associated-like protein